MVKYELRKESIEILYKDREKIAAGCIELEDNSKNPEIISDFNSLMDAMEALDSRHSDIRELSGPLGTYYLVTEYYIEENEYNKDGDWVTGGEVLAYSYMPMVEYRKKEAVCDIADYLEDIVKNEPDKEKNLDDEARIYALFHYENITDAEYREIINRAVEEYKNRHE